MANETAASEVALDNKRGSLGIESVKILLGRGFRKVVDVLGQPGIEELNNFQTFVGFLIELPWPSTEVPSERKRRQDDSRGGVEDGFPIEEGNLHQEASDVLHSLTFMGSTTADEP